MADGGAQAPRPTTRRLQRMVRAYREAGALLAGVELDLFTHIANGADDEASLTKAMGLQPLHGERIIVAMLGLGLIERRGDKLVLTPDVERFLVKGKPTYAGEWMLFTKPDWDEWGRLAEVLKEQAPPVLENKTVANITIDEARRYHRGTYSIGRGAGRLFLSHVDLSGKRLMMDIGGGSGAYCIEACKRHPDLKAVVLEMPAVVPVTQEFIDENGMTGRVEARVCDFNHDPFPEGADVAVMASNLP
ncbi:MAG: methyltransferase, partial [Alphaproteobacteria bacterium]